jgi:hypothetical protein
VTRIAARRDAKLLSLACVVLLVAGCAFVRRNRLLGRWKSESTPERTLDLFEDGSYSMRLSGKGLGFVSDILGPVKGRWSLQGDSLVLVHDDGGVEKTEKWPINELHRNDAVLAGERWHRVEAFP